MFQWTWTWTWDLRTWTWEGRGDGPKAGTSGGSEAAQAYIGGLAAVEPPAGSRGKAPGGGSGRSLLES